MNRIEFMRELEYLLQDIPSEDKEDALAYYRDYLEEAGDTQEEQAIMEFGSPERVAAIIRSDLAGALEDGGTFTEAGYKDERFRDPNYQVMEHRNLPEVSEDILEANDGKKSSQKKRPKSNDTIWMRFLKVGALLVLLTIVSPLILGLGGGAIGIIAGLGGIFLALVLCVGILTIVACIVAVVLFVLGIGMLLSQLWWSGILILGVSILMLGFTCLGIAVSILIYGKLIPACVRCVVNLISRLMHRGGTTHG